MPRNTEIDNLVKNTIPSNLHDDYDQIIDMELENNKSMSEIYNQASEAISGWQGKIYRLNHDAGAIRRGGPTNFVVTGTNKEKSRKIADKIAGVIKQVEDMQVILPRLERLSHARITILESLRMGGDPHLHRGLKHYKYTFYENIFRMEIWNQRNLMIAIRAGKIAEVERIQREREMKKEAETQRRIDSAKERRTSQKIQNRIFREDQDLTNFEKQDKLKAELKAIRRIDQIKTGDLTKVYAEKPIEEEIKKLIPAITASSALIIAGAGYLLLRKRRR